jgi:serine/threonine protein kinase
MAPEQLSGQPSDAGVDLFTVGLVLYEMITENSPFAGANMIQTMHAILHDRPPVLTDSSTVNAVDRIIQRSLEKQPVARYQSAREMADDVRNAMATSDVSGEVPVARALTRLVVLPLRVLRSDPETDFMAFGLADAITSSLAILESLIVRSSLAAAEFAEGIPDWKRLAKEIDMDAVLTGTLMRAGDQELGPEAVGIRASSQPAQHGEAGRHERVRQQIRELEVLQHEAWSPHQELGASECAN